jgi:hypothetical protein
MNYTFIKMMLAGWALAVLCPLARSEDEGLSPRMTSPEPGFLERLVKNENLTAVTDRPIFYLENEDGTVTPAYKADDLDTFHMWNGVAVDPSTIPDFDLPPLATSLRTIYGPSAAPIKALTDLGFKIKHIDPVDVFYRDPETGFYLNGYYDRRTGYFFLKSDRNYQQPDLPLGAKIVQRGPYDREVRAKVRILSDAERKAFAEAHKAAELSKISDNVPTPNLDQRSQAAPVQKPKAADAGPVIEPDAEPSHYLAILGIIAAFGICVAAYRLLTRRS